LASLAIVSIQIDGIPGSSFEVVVTDISLKLRLPRCSGTGTNLKVFGKAPEKLLFVVPLHFFTFWLSKKHNISRYGERFRDGQYSLVSFLFAVLLTVPPVPSNL